jgi:hypothetical protein
VATVTAWAVLREATDVHEKGFHLRRRQVRAHRSVMNNPLVPGGLKAAASPESPITTIEPGDSQHAQYRTRKPWRETSAEEETERGTVSDREGIAEEAGIAAVRRCREVHTEMLEIWRMSKEWSTV